MFHSVQVADLSPVAIVSLTQPRVYVSLYHFLKARDGHPDPKISLSQCVSSVNIASANQEMQRVIVVAHLPIASHELADARSPQGWAAMEVLTARNIFLRVNHQVLKIVQDFVMHLKSMHAQ